MDENLVRIIMVQRNNIDPGPYASKLGLPKAANGMQKLLVDKNLGQTEIKRVLTEL